MNKVLQTKKKTVQTIKAEMELKTSSTVISVKTERGNIVSMRLISAEEIKAKRNTAYNYLA